MWMSTRSLVLWEQTYRGFFACSHILVFLSELLETVHCDLVHILQVEHDVCHLESRNRQHLQKTSSAQAIMDITNLAISRRSCADRT